MKIKLDREAAELLAYTLGAVFLLVFLIVLQRGCQMNRDRDVDIRKLDYQHRKQEAERMEQKK